MKRFHAHKKHKTHISEQKQKRQHFYTIKKPPRGRKSLIRLFEFCAFYAFCAFCAFAWLRLCAFYDFYALCASKIFS